MPKKVVIDNPDGSQVRSTNMTLAHGVPQGIALGPVLFNLYTSTLGDIARNRWVLFHAYADDQQTYLSFKPTIQGAKAEYLNRLQNCIADIQTWMHTNLLKLNNEKTEFVLFGTRQHLEIVGEIII